ncbi:proton-coupled amino acid transporter 3-like protein [Trifolium pratense]|uniref:Proton-coupled amino acid transporter 3-like protein n=1 Tax=Trifolium pratense TaxID=57577 RepID=A0A2K3PLN7_TRIPR|nr:proton-coupled amino acid transporter 3-like protein [Trifolium pratense]
MGYGEEQHIPLISSPPPLSSKFKTFANIFISIVGAGVLGLPYSFKKTGWIMGLLMLFSVAFLTYHCMMLLIHTRRRLELNVGFRKINSFGVAVYAFEGIGMVLPLESEAKDKDKFGGILGLGMMLISLLYGGFATLGYFAFGEETQGIITTNLGHGMLSALLVELGLA